MLLTACLSRKREERREEERRRGGGGDRGGNAQQHFLVGFPFSAVTESDSLKTTVVLNRGNRRTSDKGKNAHRM